MRNFIKNNSKTIFRAFIFILFVLPSIILSYLALLGLNVKNGQAISVSAIPQFLMKIMIYYKYDYQTIL